jgi:hypothetical protein
MHDHRTGPRSRKAPAALPSLPDHVTQSAWVCGMSSGDHNHAGTSVARAIRRALRRVGSLSSGSVGQDQATNLAMSLRRARPRQGCADCTKTELSLSCLGITLVLILAVWGESIAAAAVEALR